MHRLHPDPRKMRRAAETTAIPFICMPYLRFEAHAGYMEMPRPESGQIS